ncbi:hypothetical protein HY469_05035 [Candidatus Roizmanbacteria bacterium]|nr:hypothetical protein [Candidatus Roizmanbacteria bacterium]
MNTRQKAILVGMILGDAFLQKTGQKNARIRLEQSEKQREYLVWKAHQFPEFFQGKPVTLTRTNPVYQKTYSYVRWQSNASPEIGKYRYEFYQDSKKIIPTILPKLLRDPISLAVWYMDDGYLYHRDIMAYIYIPRLTSEECNILLTTLDKNFGLQPRIVMKKRGEYVLSFNVTETKKLLSLIAQFVIPSMRYKLLDPVSTEA